MKGRLLIIIDFQLLNRLKATGDFDLASGANGRLKLNWDCSCPFCLSYPRPKWSAYSGYCRAPWIYTASESGQLQCALLIFSAALKIPSSPNSLLHCRYPETRTPLRWGIISFPGASFCDSKLPCVPEIVTGWNWMETVVIFVSIMFAVIFLPSLLDLMWCDKIVKEPENMPQLLWLYKQSSVQCVLKEF